MDAALVLGGDGSIIEASHMLLGENIPILGINLGHLGYMAELELDELDLLGNLFNGDYTEFVGEMDLILKPFINRSAQIGFDTLRWAREKVYMIRHRDMTCNPLSYNSPQATSSLR